MNAPSSAASAMVLALRELRLKLSEGDYDRLRSIMTGGDVVIHRGETVTSLVKRLDEGIRAALPGPAALLFVGDLPEADWERAFEAAGGEDRSGGEG